MSSALKGGPAILQFLKNSTQLQLNATEIQGLNDLTQAVLEASNDSPLHDLLDKCGWDKNEKQFDDTMRIDVLMNGLHRLHGSRKENNDELRVSQVGQRNTTKSFAPDMLMRYTLEKGMHTRSKELEPFSVFFDGVCLLADISGFTRLSGKFCEGGKDGIDKLQQVVNDYLSQLVKTVYAYGGDVMKFAGDALVCVFQQGLVKGLQIGLEQVCSNAVQCATVLAQICTDQLTIHVAVSCGSICFAMLGGYADEWECLVSGECFGHLSLCLEDAGSKHTVVSPQFIDMLGPLYKKELNIEQLSTGNYRVISAAQMNSLVVRKLIKRRGERLMKGCESRFVMFPDNDQFLSHVSQFVPKIGKNMM
jgi:hypothetical protein